MKVYLVRHGEASEGSDDDSRALTEKGGKETEAAASFLKKSGVIDISVIYHSMKKRAEETAGIFEKHLKPASGKVESPWLKPNDNVDFWMRKIRESEYGHNKSGIMLVGHLPYIRKLAVELLEIGKEKDVLNIPPSAVLCLDNNDNGGWKLIFMVVSGLFKDENN